MSTTVYRICVYHANGWIDSVFEYTDKIQAKIKYLELCASSEGKVVRNFND